MTATTDAEGRGIAVARLKEDVSDGALSFRVNGIRDLPAQPIEYGDPITPPAGGSLKIVSVVVRNDGQTPVMPFCGGTGATLVDADRRNFSLVSDTYAIPGNTTCQELQPGFKATQKLAFMVPEGTSVRSIVLWDPDEDQMGSPEDYAEVLFD